jgi:hypothetical protein
VADRWPALTLWQPWASAIGPWPEDKDVENRTWETTYRGMLLIHAGKRVEWSAPRKAWNATGLGPPPHGARRSAWLASLPKGAIVAVARLADCHEDCGGVCSPWAIAGQCHWVLADARRLPRPVPATGKQGLWWLPEDVEKAVREQLEDSRA